MRRLRVLRRLLAKYRAAGKIDKHLYHELYQESKGNTFKHKRALVEHVCSPSYNDTSKRLTLPRFTRRRPRSNVRRLSRTRWTRDAPRSRLPVRGESNERQPRRTLLLVRRRPPRSRRRKTHRWGFDRSRTKMCKCQRLQDMLQHYISTQSRTIGGQWRNSTTPRLTTYACCALCCPSRGTSKQETYHFARVDDSNFLCILPEGGVMPKFTLKHD